MERPDGEITIVGGGPVGSLLSIFLSKLGFQSTIYERRKDIREVASDPGCSLNLAMCCRGMRALRAAGLEPAILEQSVPMLGRFIHAADGSIISSPYGDDKVVYSLNRASVNKLLLTEAEATGRVSVKFKQRCSGIDLPKRTLQFTDEISGEPSDVHADVVMGVDGATSVLRNAIEQRSDYDFSRTMMDYGYKELVVPAAEAESLNARRNGLHLWGRFTYFLNASPLADGSWACKLVLPVEGKLSFESLKTLEDVRRLFNEQFKDFPLSDNTIECFMANPLGRLKTIKLTPWNSGDQLLLLGDAAHAMVPFLAQGMNCSFDGLTVLSDCIQRDTGDGAGQKRPQWNKVFADFFSLRKKETDAMAEMAMDSLHDLRSRALDARFQLKKRVEKRLEREFPGRFRSLFDAITFSTIPYSRVARIGVAAEEILTELTEGVDTPDAIDIARAEQLLATKMDPLLLEEQCAVGA